MDVTDEVQAEPASGLALQAALRRATTEVIIEKGLGGFSLREVARRAGVSHAAPGYHFGDLQGLLTSVAIEGFETLHHELEVARSTHPDPVERLAAIGRAYVRVSINFPAHCEVMFREDLINVSDPLYETAGLQAYGVLESTIAAIAGAHNPAMSVSDASKLCWSSMQGLVQLYPKLARMDGVRGEIPHSVEETVDRFTAMLLAGLLDG